MAVGENFRSGTILQGQPLGMVKKTVLLTADDTVIDVAGFSMLDLRSDSTTAANRTFTLVASSQVGHELTIVFTSGSSNTAQLVDTGTTKLTADWTPLQYDTLTLVSDGTNWIEKGRGVTSGVTDIPLTQNNILVGNSSGLAADVAMSGDATIVASGALTIANNAVTTAKINTAAVTLAKLASGITPSHIVAFAGSFTTAGGDANETITVTGAAATDIAIVQLHTKGATPRTILTAQAATNAINIEMSGDPSTDHVLRYMVLRAAS